MLALAATVISRSPIEVQASLPPGSAGQMIGWGYNQYGQLGDGNNTTVLNPIAASLPSGTTVVAVTGGDQQTLALTSSGNVLASGRNNLGQLGNGNTNDSNVPVQVSLPIGTIVIAIASGYNHGLALTSAGQVWAWGLNASGQLGNGTTTINVCACLSTPVQVSLPTGTTVIAIAGGGNHSLAVTSTGGVLAWGANAQGQLGNGTLTTTGCSCIPTPALATLPSGTIATRVAAGRQHSLALTSTGAVLAWGRNNEGQVGTVNCVGPFDVSTPFAVPVGASATAIAAGDLFSLALTSSGGIQGWGFNASAELGDGTQMGACNPVSTILFPGTIVTAIVAGNSHSLALTSTGVVLGWGQNLNGQVGTGSTSNHVLIPIAVSALHSVVTAIGAGAFHSLAVEVLPSRVALPALANGAYGGYVTAATIQNTGTAAASIRIAYFDQSGAAVGSGESTSSLPVNASWTVRQDTGHSFPSSGGDGVQAGSAIVYSDQPVAVFVNEFAPGNVGDATSYSGVQVNGGIGTSLYAPTIVNNAYGGYTTGIGLLSLGSGGTADVTITYRDGSGAVVKTQTVPAIPGHGYRALYSGDAALALPSGFAGTATISSVSPLLAAVVNETGPGGQFSSYDAVPVGTTALNAPVALNSAFGGYYTGMGIQNTSATAGTVTVTYYDADGAPTVKSFPIGANGSLGVYQGSAMDGPAVGAYTATITSTVAIAAIVNEVAPSSTSAKQSTSYNAFSAGSATLNLPLVENAGSDPWNTGEGIMNTGGSTTVTVNYYDTVTGAPIGTAQTQALAPHAFWGLYQPGGGLPSGSRATAVITTSTMGQVAVICNESSTTTFMSYGGQ